MIHLVLDTDSEQAIRIERERLASQILRFDADSLGAINIGKDARH